MNNKEKAARLLLEIGEPYSSNILKHLSDKENLILIQEMAKIDENDRVVNFHVLGDLVGRVLKLRNIGIYGSKGVEVKS
jgi:flagellar motor switch protein FliG